MFSMVMRFKTIALNRRCKGFVNIVHNQPLMFPLDIKMLSELSNIIFMPPNKLCFYLHYYLHYILFYSSKC